MGDHLDVIKVGYIPCIGCTRKPRLLNKGGLNGHPREDHVEHHQRHAPVSHDEKHCPGSGHKPGPHRQIGQFIRM